MTNAREELLKLLKGKEIKCAKVTTDSRTIVLKVGYDEVDYAKFLNDLNFEYYSGYGGQELFGIVWFKDNTWAGRDEYDGSEWWVIYSLPDIPSELL